MTNNQHEVLSAYFFITYIMVIITIIFIYLFIALNILIGYCSYKIYLYFYDDINNNHND